MVVIGYHRNSRVQLRSDADSVSDGKRLCLH